MSQKKDKNTNASAVERGFHYQDMVGLIEFLDNIKKAEAVNVEGKDDIDLILTNGNKYYYQAKETKDPYKSKMSEEFKKALKTLNADAKDNKMSRIIYVSNSVQPLGGAKNSQQFKLSYAFYNYGQLEPILQQKIDKKINNNSALKYIKKNLTRLYILKISYEGANDRAKLRELNDRVDDFTEVTKLNNYKHELKNEWQQMIIRSTEEKSRTIEKRDFYSHTVITVMFSNRSNSRDLDDFLNEFDVSYGNENYIKEQYNEIVGDLYNDFSQVNKIYSAYKSFNEKNAVLARSERLKKFVETYFPVLKKDLGRTDKKDNDVVKFFIWITIKSYNLADDVKEAINYETD